MPRVHSHYDNLKVARDAPPEVIRAAYRSLTLKYHPDRNTGNDDTVRVMIMLNAAYETLSDPARREEHDRWIAENEAEEHATQASPSLDLTVRAPASPQAGKLMHHLLGNWYWYGLVVLVLTFALALASWLNEQLNAPVLSYKMLRARATSAGRRDQEPDAAPSMLSIPSVAGYIKGFQKLRSDGHSAITVDNSQNDFGIFAMLVAIDGRADYPVRHFFIPASGSFTLDDVSSGNYDIRYRDLKNGGLTRSEVFSLAETQPDTLTLVLHKPQ